MTNNTSVPDIEQLKSEAAKVAIGMLDMHDDWVLGIGTGSTVAHFISALEPIVHNFSGAVASSKASAEQLQAIGMPVLDLNVIDKLPVYVDGADAVDSAGVCLKGGGGAMTGEKIVANVAKKFICIVDDSKWMQSLAGPVPVEVLPAARSLVGRALVKLGGDPVYREGFVTDNGNCILDVFGLNLLDVYMLEDKINALPGVVENGIFAHRHADHVIVAGSDGDVSQYDIK